jgi:putative phosphoesterase
VNSRPTRVALLSDIHGNAVALHAVLEDMRDVDAIICAGDIVGYGPSPGQCIETVRDRGIPTVQGNHDRAVAQGQPYESGDRYAHATLSEGAMEWLEALPRERLLFDDRVKLVHDHPDERDRYTMPAGFTPMLLGDEAVLVLGHTHIQHAEVYEEGVVVNPGSVGQPRDDDPKAAYAIVDLDGLSVDLRRVAYDIERVQERITAAGISEHNARRLTQQQ